MARKLTDLTQATNISSDDLMYLVNNPSGTKDDRSLSMATLFASVPSNLSTAGPNPWFDVTNPAYGALNNNTNAATTTAGINAAIAAANAYSAGSAVGATVWFPPGRYSTNAALTAPGNHVTLLGTGFSRATSPLPATIIKSSLTTTPMWDWGNASGVILRDICLQGAGSSGNKDAHCITGSGINDCTFDNVEILQFGGSAIRLAGSNNHLQDLYIIGCNSDYASLAAYQGVIHITAGEQWLYNIEAAGGSGIVHNGVVTTSYDCAFYIGASQIRAYNCVAEYGQAGWVLNGGGDWNYFNYCRGEGCQGSGWLILGVKNQLSECHANGNSQGIDNTYDAYDVESGSNFFNNCVAGPTAGSFYPRYAFTDNYGSAADTIAFANVYANCRASFGIHGRVFNITGAVKPIITPNPKIQVTNPAGNSLTGTGTLTADGEAGDTWRFNINANTTSVCTATNTLPGHEYNVEVINSSGSTPAITLDTMFKTVGYSAPANGKRKTFRVACDTDGTTLQLIGAVSADF